MNSTAAGWLQFGLLFAALAACYVPLGNYIARIFTTDKDWPVERAFYKLIGIVPGALAWNTAASFVTNTNWQNYAGEATLGYVAQASGLVVQQFMSAAVGLC